MSREKLQSLVEMAKQYPMSAEEREAQRVSFAYGNTAFENAAITKDDVVRASKRMKDEADATDSGQHPGSPAR